MSLQANDLKFLVSHIFEVDAYKSKIGKDEDIAVLSFTSERNDPAKDLENFVEMGYSFVLDADVSPGEADDGKFRVFVEIERTRHLAEQIAELVSGVEKLIGQPLRFRFFKGFRSQPATLENLENVIPTNKDAYTAATEKNVLENFSNFFSNSYVDNIQLLDESIRFKQVYADPIEFKIINSGPKSEVYAACPGPIMLEGNGVAEIVFFTKYIGNYNITKIGKTFIFERDNWAVALEKIYE